MKAIIFDMDGTLFRTDTILEKALDKTFEYFRNIGVWKGDTPIEKYREIMGVPLPVVWETLLPDHDEEIRKEADNHFLQSLISLIGHGQGDLYPGVLESLGSLKQSGYKIFIASNGKREYLKAIVDFYQLEQWVTETFSIEQIDSLNKSELVRNIIEKYGITSGAMVGDRLSDIHAGKGNGLTAIGCHFDFAQEEELAQADIVIRHFDELIEIIGMGVK